jgi:hypothetical protein
MARLRLPRFRRGKPRCPDDPMANNSRLSAPQLALLDQMVAVITPESYTPGPGREAAQNRMRALEPKLAELFSPDDIQAAMQPSGPCLPKGK